MEIMPRAQRVSLFLNHDSSEPRIIISIITQAKRVGLQPQLSKGNLRELN